MASLRKEDYVFDCQYCGKQFKTANIRRLYCCEKCRRDYQNERRMYERAERSEVLAASHWKYDPWEVNDLDNIEQVFSNALKDGWTGTPCGLTMCADEAVAGAMACISCQMNEHRQPSLYGKHFPWCDDEATDPQQPRDNIGDEAAVHSDKDSCMPISSYTGHATQTRIRKHAHKKEAARAKRRYRKRLEARAKQEG